MKFYILSPKLPLNQCLFPTFTKPFEEHGHKFTQYIGEANIILWDLHTRIADYEQADIDWVVRNKIPISVFCEYDRGWLSTETYPNPLTEQQRQIFNLIDNNETKSVHFCRLMDKIQTYKYEMFPYEKSISYQEPMLTAYELFGRMEDVCYIANTAPSREAIAKVLREDGRLRCRILLGATKLPFDEFLKQHKKAKLFISSGAGGYTDERKQCLFSVAGLIQERTNQVLLHPHTHLDNCLKLNNPPLKHDIDTIVDIVNNKDRLFDIYRNNFNFMKHFYSADYIANSILKKIIKHLA